MTRKRWIAVAAVAAVGLLALAGWRFMAWRAGPSALDRQLDQAAAADPYLAALQQHFPDDYAALRQAALDDLRSARTPQEARARLQARTREQAVRTAGQVAAAPAAQLAAVVEAEQAVIHQLQAEDVRQCAQFGMTGLPPGTQTSPATTRLISRAAEARVKAARAGTDTPVAHAAPGEADLEALRAAMIEAGASEALTGLILSPQARAAGAVEQCAGSVAFYDALAALPDETAARWMSAVTKQAAGTG